jgi:hypothetical protein
VKKTETDPQSQYQEAEALRKAHRNDEARARYQQAINSSDARTQERGERALTRLDGVNRRLGWRIYPYVLLPFVLGGVLYAGYHLLNERFEAQRAETDPKSFVFIEWLAEQQTREIVSNLMQANPELQFSFNRATSDSAMSPLEAMQTLMSQRLQDQIREGDQPGDDSAAGDGEGDGEPPFSCSVDKPVACSSVDKPTAPGERREDIALLVRSYRTVLDNEKDCSKIETAIQSLAEQIQWRSSESTVKAELEHLALSCYSRQKDNEKVIEHARKLQCAGDTNSVNTSYWYLTASYHQTGDLAAAQRMYTCFNETVDHLAKYKFEPSNIASRHRESGALAWLYFNDLDAAVGELEKARNILQKAKTNNLSLEYVASEVDLDLMETYVTANIDLPTFIALHEDINSSGLLTDGYKQIKDTLAGIYYLQNKQNEKAVIALDNVATRFEQLPEYICSWDWSGFQRALSDSIADPQLRQKADQLVVATDCYVPQSIDQRIQKVREVVQWLQRP